MVSQPGLYTPGLFVPPPPVLLLLPEHALASLLCLAHQVNPGQTTRHPVTQTSDARPCRAGQMAGAGCSMCCGTTPSLMTRQENRCFSCCCWSGCYGQKLGQLLQLLLVAVGWVAAGLLQWDPCCCCRGCRSKNSSRGSRRLQASRDERQGILLQEVFLCKGMSEPPSSVGAVWRGGEAIGQAHHHCMAPCRCLPPASCPVSFGCWGLAACTTTTVWLGHIPFDQTVDQR